MTSNEKAELIRNVIKSSSHKDKKVAIDYFSELLDDFEFNNENVDELELDTIFWGLDKGNMVTEWRIREFLDTLKVANAVTLF